MAEDPNGGEVRSIKSRIAALNLVEVGRAPPPSYERGAASQKARPPPPPRPTAEHRSHTINNPPLQNYGISSPKPIGNLPIGRGSGVIAKTAVITPVAGVDLSVSEHKPTLPPRPLKRASQQAPPPLPSRKSSAPSVRTRSSVESFSSTLSTHSSISGKSSRTSISGTSAVPGELPAFKIRAPPYDPSKLPPLPPKRNKDEGEKGRLSLKSTRSTPTIPKRSPSNLVPSAPLRTSPKPTVLAIQPPPSLPSRPPLPSRPGTTAPQADVERVTPKRSALAFALNKSTEKPPPLPSDRPGEGSNDEDSQPPPISCNRPGQSAGTPPPVPMASRPSLAAIQSSKPSIPPQASCLICRDFSGPDDHAARFPREAIPSTDIGWLATQLTAPFPSATDKARAIFIWLHHNIAYNTKDFFAGSVKSSTPASTIATGLAVCEGYAALFTALATKAGLESRVISGHGKGFGHTPIAPGASIPPRKSGHAWNVVKIDNGQWKLIDCCWGSGCVEGSSTSYTKRLAPERFTQSNEDFGYDHFPEDQVSFFRSDGRAEITWEEYYMQDCGRPTIFGSIIPDHGLSNRRFLPIQTHIKVNDPSGPATVRFQFEKVCPHWDNERHGAGKPYVLVVQVQGQDGRKKEDLPMQTDGDFWWLDVPRTQLGAPGQTVHVWAITQLGGKDARGVTVAEYKAYLNSRGAKSWSYGGVASWALA